MSIPAEVGDLSVCKNGGFFDGNDDFGGPPYRFFIGSLVVSPLVYLACSSAWWVVGSYRRRSAERAAAALVATGAVPSTQQQSNYQTLIESSPSFPSFSPNPDCYDVENQSVSPSSSSSVAPLSTSLLSSSEQAIASNDTHVPTVSLHTQFLLFLRSLTRPSPLFALTLVISSFQFIATFAALFVGIINSEHCCMGGTGALYATLCLRLCLAYLNIRVGWWQTHSRSTTIAVADKSCEIGFLIHYIWLSFAFVLIEQGDCSANAPVMYGVSMMNVIFLLINYSILFVFFCINYIVHNTTYTSDLLIVLSRTMMKLMFVGWIYGSALDTHDAVTDVELEIACLPCVSVEELMKREEQRTKRRVKIAEKWTGTNDEELMMSVVIEDVRTDEQKILDNDAVIVASSSSPSSSESDEVETLSCAICLSAYEPSDMIRPLPCGHHLHKSCSDSWLKVKSTCPLCVRSVLIH